MKSTSLIIIALFTISCTVKPQKRVFRPITPITPMIAQPPPSK